MATSKRAKRRLHNEAMQIIISCFGSLGFLAAMLPEIALGPIGMLLLMSGSVTALAFVIANVRWGTPIGHSILLALAPGVITFCVLYGCTWYFISYVMTQPDLFKFSLPPTPSAPLK